MKKNEILFENLKLVLRRYRLRYDDGTSSSSGEAIEAVRLPWYRVWRWSPELEKRAGNQRIIQAAGNAGWSTGWKELEKLINDPLQNNTVTFLRNTNNDEEVDLYILVPFGWWYVGIRTVLINA